MATSTKLAYAHIVKEPGYCGGKAAIGATRIRVNNVVWLHKEGRSPQQSLETYPDLTLGQVHAALAYYYDHKDEIETELAEDEGAAERYERERAEDLARRTSK